jgi:hypothetical protein
MWKFKEFQSFIAIAGMLLIAPMAGFAQYFTLEHPAKEILKSSDHDSVILQSSTPFEVPAVNDTVSLTYHEPMPDSIMPRSAIVIGTIVVQSEQSEDVISMMEKYARKLGADWIVSFQEPRALLAPDRWKVYRSTALLLHVLDDRFIDQNSVEYSYYGPNHLQNYAAVTKWYDMYSKHYGARVVQSEPVLSDTGQEEQK